MWLITEYEATSLYSLKPSTATSSVGKTLLAPTPYALKMALLDIACRTQGVAAAEELWPTIRDLSIAYLPPEKAVVTNLFTRVLKPNRNPPPPLARTIGYREYVYFAGPLGLALSTIGSIDVPEFLPMMAVSVHYLGKRGGFMQPLRPAAISTGLPSGYVPLNQPGGQTQFHKRGVLQLLDDCGPKMTFAQASIYSGKRVRMGHDRLSFLVVLPYRVRRTSKSYTLYERMD